jgi:hypothetical protein
MKKMEVIDTNTISMEERIQNWNEELDEAAASSASAAFNLGCWLGLIVVITTVILVFVLSRRNLIGLIVYTVMSMLIIVALANLAAYFTKKRASSRRYHEVIAPEIEEFKNRECIPTAKFLEMAHQSLPDGSILLQLLQE